MSATFENLKQQVMVLPAQERIRLVSVLLDSLEASDGFATANIKQAWLDEVKRRYDAYLRGEMEAVPAEEVFAELAQEDAERQDRHQQEIRKLRGKVDCDDDADTM